MRYAAIEFHHGRCAAGHRRGADGCCIPKHPEHPVCVCVVVCAVVHRYMYDVPGVCMFVGVNGGGEEAEVLVDMAVL